MGENQLEIRNLNVVYANGVNALKDVSLSIPNGIVVGVLGPNGGGKTTFIKGLLGLVPSRGKVLYKDQAIKKFAKNIAYVQQKQEIDMDFPISVFQCVLMGTYPKLGLFRRPGKVEKEKALKALEVVDLADYKNYQIGELSGGQFQRVLFARTLVQDADLIFLDEPLVGIDVRSEAIIIKEIKKLAKQGKTILIVHHDLNKVRAYFDQVILINKTLIASGKTEEVYTKEHMKKTFEFIDNPLFQ